MVQTSYRERFTSETGLAAVVAIIGLGVKGEWPLFGWGLVVIGALRLLAEFVRRVDRWMR